MQEVVLVDDQDNVIGELLARETGPSEPFALISAVGGAPVTAIGRSFDADPPGPEHDNVNVVLAIRFPELCEPDVDFGWFQF